MPQPTARQLHVNTLLTDYGMGYAQTMAAFAGDKAATLKRVEKQSNYYAVWSKSDFYRSEMKATASGEPAPKSGFTIDTSNTYFTPVYELATFLADRERANSDVDIEKAKTRYLIQQAKLKRDKLWAAACFATGLWTSNTEQTGTASAPSTNQFLKFSDPTSDPLKVITDQLLVVELSTGFRPNLAVCNPVVEMALRRHPDIVARFQYVKGGDVSLDQVAALLGLEQIIVGKAVENTANEGQSASMARVFGNHLLLAYINPQPTDEAPTAVTGFAWSEFDQVDANGAAIKSWRSDDPEGEYFKAEQAIQYKITANDCGVFLLNAAA